MKQQVPTWLAVLIIIVVVVIAGLIVWRKAGEKPIAGFPETGMPMHKGAPTGPTAP